MELRYFGMPELRVAADGKQIGGYAAKYGVLSRDLGGFRERIAYRAFDKILATKPDTVALFNHNVNYVLGRTSAGTLRLAGDGVGLKFECDLPDTSYAHDLHESVKRGDINQVSFGFQINQGDDEMNQEDVPEEGRFLIRTIRNFKSLMDISPCTNAAYPDTSISARSEDVAVEVRNYVAQLLNPRLADARTLPVIDFYEKYGELPPKFARLVEARQVVKRRKNLLDFILE